MGIIYESNQIAAGQFMSACLFFVGMLCIKFILIPQHLISKARTLVHSGSKCAKWSRVMYVVVFTCMCIAAEYNSVSKDK